MHYFRWTIQDNASNTISHPNWSKIVTGSHSFIHYSSQLFHNFTFSHLKYLKLSPMIEWVSFNPAFHIVNHSINCRSDTVDYSTISSPTKLTVWIIPLFHHLPSWQYGLFHYFITYQADTVDYSTISSPTKLTV